MLAHRLAVVTAAATFVLILFGGLVTSTGAGLTVPDWPSTFGQNMFLFPWARMVGGVLFEHSHRLLGALVGLLTLGLGATLMLDRRAGWPRALGAAAGILVCAQGLLGGLRVVLRDDTLAIVHGCAAQAFFALLVALTVVTSPGWTAAVPPLVAIMVTVRSARVRSRSTTSTLVPSRASRIAAARPSPMPSPAAPRPRQSRPC